MLFDPEVVSLSVSDPLIIFCQPREINSHVAEAGYVISGSVKRGTKVDVNIRQKITNGPLKFAAVSVYPHVKRISHKGNFSYQ